MYPFNFRPDNPFIDDRLIFIAMPFKDELESLYSDLILPAINGVNEKLKPPNKYYPWRAKDFKYTRMGWIEILNKIWTSRLLIGVLTDNNANVFYELGIAHSTQQISRQILIAENDYEPKFDLKDLTYIIYDLNDLNNSKKLLCNSIIDMLEFYDYNNDLIISKTISTLGYYDFEIVLKFGQYSHFTIPNHFSIRFKDGVSVLTKSRLLRLSVKRKLKNNFEYSFYWTNLGNAILRKLDIINENEFYKRKIEYHRFFKI